jgi:hypothetical protein
MLHAHIEQNCFNNRQKIVYVEDSDVLLQVNWYARMVDCLKLKKPTHCITVSWEVVVEKCMR